MPDQAGQHRQGATSSSRTSSASPNNRIPAIVDNAPLGGGEPIAIFESGAILIYLAEKTGRLLPAETRGKFEVLQWLFWQVGGLGPMAGQNHHFVQYASEKIPYAIDRYVRETARLYRVLDTRLADWPYPAIDYSIADIACYPWTVPTSGSGRTSTNSRISSAGSPPSPSVLRWSGATPSQPRC